MGAFPVGLSQVLAAKFPRIGQVIRSRNRRGLGPTISNNEIGAATTTRRYEVNLKRILEGKDADIPLEREDIVYIPPSTARTLLFHTPQVLESAAASATVYAQAP